VARYRMVGMRPDALNRDRSGRSFAAADQTTISLDTTPAGTGCVQSWQARSASIVKSVT